MEEPKSVVEKARVIATHGRKKNQGMLAMVNRKMALTYTEGKGENLEVVSYIFMEELLQQGSTCELPQYQLDF